MKIVKYQCDVCKRNFQGENNKNIITFQTSDEGQHICKDCFEKFDKDIAYSIQYINRLTE